MHRAEPARPVGKAANIETHIGVYPTEGMISESQSTQKCLRP